MLLNIEQNAIISWLIGKVKVHGGTGKEICGARRAKAMPRRAMRARLQAYTYYYAIFNYCVGASGVPASVLNIVGDRRYYTDPKYYPKGRACALRVPYTTQYGRDVTEAGPGTSTIACAQSCYHLGIHHSPSVSPRLGVGASPTGREHACFPNRAPCNEVFQLLSAYLRDRR